MSLLGTGVTDAGLDLLEEEDSLIAQCLAGTEVSREVVDRLRRALLT